MNLIIISTQYVITSGCDYEPDDCVTRQFLIMCLVVVCIVTLIITALLICCITCLCYHCSSKRRNPSSNQRNPPNGGVAAKRNGVSTDPEALIAGSGNLDCGSIGVSVVNNHTRERTGTEV